jgi:hypothetical protein
MPYAYNIMQCCSFGNPETPQGRQYCATPKPPNVNAEALFTVNVKNGDAVSFFAVLRQGERQGMEDAHLGLRSRCDVGSARRTHSGTAGNFVAESLPRTLAAAGAIGLETHTLRCPAAHAPSPNKRIAFSFRISGRTSSRIATFSKSSSHRSGEING